MDRRREYRPPTAAMRWRWTVPSRRSGQGRRRWNWCSSVWAVPLSTWCTFCLVRQEIGDCVAEIEADRAATDPKVFTRIHIHFKVSGRGLDAKKVAHAIELSATKYRSASIMLGKTAQITHDYEIVETG